MQDSFRHRSSSRSGLVRFKTVYACTPELEKTLILNRQTAAFNVAAESLIERDYLERAADPKIYKYLA